MGHSEPAGRLDKGEVLRRVRGELNSVVWAPAFEGRTSTRHVWRMWVIHPGVDDGEGRPWIYADSRGRVRHIDFTSPAQRLLRALAFVVLVVGLAALVSRIYPGQWCGTEVTRSGSTRNICRDPEVTDPAIVAVGVVVLASLGIFFTEISGFGVTLRRRVDKADKNARRSLRQIRELEEVRAFVQETQADFTDANVRNEERLLELERAVREIWHRLGGGDDGERGSPAAARRRDVPGAGLGSEEVLDQADEYNRCRRTMVAGPDRSAAMEEILTRMRTALRSVTVPDEEVERRLGDAAGDRGLRLAVYAYLMEHPAPRLASLLVKAASTEDKPFGQYTALRAVKRMVDVSERGLPPGLTLLLNEIAVTAGRGTDRYREVASILSRDRAKPRDVV